MRGMKMQYIVQAALTVGMVPSKLVLVLALLMMSTTLVAYAVSAEPVQACLPHCDSIPLVDHCVAEALARCVRRCERVVSS